MKQIGRVDGAGLLQQFQRCGVGRTRCLDHGLVFGRVFVGLEQDLVELILDGLGAIALSQFLGPDADLLGKQALLFYGGQRLGNDLGRSPLEAALAGAAEVMRRLKQLEQHAGLLLQRGIVRKVVARQVGKAEFLFGRKFPGHFQLDGFGASLCGLHKGCGRWLLELDQHVAGFDFDALAAIQLHLCRGVRLRQHPTGHEFSGFFKQ